MAKHLREKIKPGEWRYRGFVCLQEPRGETVHGNPTFYWCGYYEGALYFRKDHLGAVCRAIDKWLEEDDV